MKKYILLITALSVIHSISQSQDLGYNTVDIGGDYQWNPDASSYSLHVAFNAKIHHSIILRGGYTNLEPNNIIDNSEKGNGWNASIGYRYYPNIRPYKFYIGTKIELSDLKIDWSRFIGAGTTKILVLQPTIETGYTFLINDLFFITPNIGAGYQTTINTNGSAVTYGNGFIPVIGISTGFRL